MEIKTKMLKIFILFAMCIIVVSYVYRVLDIIENNNVYPVNQKTDNNIVEIESSSTSDSKSVLIELVFLSSFIGFALGGSFVKLTMYKK